MNDIRMIEKGSVPHYTWGDGCDGWPLLATGALAIVEERMPAGTSEVRHCHEKARQFFYVLAGCLSFEVEGKTFDLNPRQGIEIGPGLSHRVFNQSDDVVEFLVISCPPSQGDRILSEEKPSV